ncbi:hypothetical protein [Morganella morganii]|uniref:hypothetical protein n=1 Tax=Morganella morganii TaxID=582 RepID=UPI000DCD169D|nr:hypothetical protein [Morganella morganii]MBT0412007.1 hypothetical protein [Morganella morganii subsp. morganii]MBV0430638.1 hypothetical protein [Morganella morganii subsp. morganii]RAX24993.1 hypothetical protein DQ401_18425 [Morganella morganii]HCT2374296.1 hypothetical protein [Morganella morganii]
MSENGPREDLAKLVSGKLLERFKWKQFGPSDHDFPCTEQESHKPVDKKQEHTHPVDVVFHYKDPYLNKTIYLNTDLKSYSKGSLNSKMVENALDSLAKTIYCAQNSEVWKSRYETAPTKSEVRGLLFVYNHDNDYKHNFYDYFYPPKPEKGNRPAAINLEKIGLGENQQIHIIEPLTINYLISVVADMNELIAENKFPREDYGFYYPQLTFHKVTTAEEYLPATVETLTSPYMIIKHGPVINYDRVNKVEVKVYQEGYIVYYNRSGKTDLEFNYLLDTLTNYQILNAKNNIRIRVAGVEKNEHIRTNFLKAIEKFVFQWGYDETMKEKLLAIELYIVPLSKEQYLTEERSWEIR